MYFQNNIVGTGSYITSTTNMYQKDRFHVRGVRLQNVALKVPQLRHQIQQFGAIARDAVIKPVLPRRGGRSGGRSLVSLLGFVFFLSLVVRPESFQKRFQRHFFFPVKIKPRPPDGGGVAVKHVDRGVFARQVTVVFHPLENQ